MLVCVYVCVCVCVCVCVRERERERERESMYLHLSSALIFVMQKSVQENEDAAQDIEGLLDDDACKIKVGEVYVQVSNDDAEDFVRDKQKEAKENLESLLGEKSKLVTEMETLKVILKGKYGNKINLDSRGDDEDHLVPEEKASR